MTTTQLVIVIVVVVALIAVRGHARRPSARHRDHPHCRKEKDGADA